MKDKIISITGYGEAKTKANYINSTISLIAENQTYDEVLNELTEKTNILKKDLYDLGFKPNNIKTSSFSINENYIYENNEKISDGYKGNHTLSVDFDYDQELLNNYIKALGNSESNPIFNITFTVKNQKPLEYAAISDAIKDATIKAELVAKQSKVDLKDINIIKYNNIVTPYRTSLYEADEALDIIPKDIIYKTNIYIEWNI